jgi:hypothetical protein
MSFTNGAVSMRVTPGGFLALLLPLTLGSLAAQAAPVSDSAQAATLLRDRRFVEAGRAYTTLTAREPGNPGHWNGLAMAEHSQGHFDRSEAAFTRALTLTPPRPPRPSRVAWYNIASARARQGKVDAALVALDSATVIQLFTPQQLDSDEDLAALRSDARFEGIKRRIMLAASPCDTMPKAREFDFWIGEWDVFAPGGNRAGSSVIQKVSNGCALLENWTGGLGTGKSLNFYNATAGYWQQTWIGSAGGPVEFRDGVLQDSTMRFIARTTGPQGEPVLSRLSFTRLGPNRVRQHAESSGDGGATWTTSYDFHYLRKGSGERP